MKTEFILLVAIGIAYILLVFAQMENNSIFKELREIRHRVILLEKNHPPKRTRAKDKTRKDEDGRGEW